jgi:hypothetical protein
MSISWKEMNPEAFAAFVGLLGPKVVRTGGLHWAEARRFFYRPLVPLREFDPATITPPRLAFLGGVQYAVPAEQEANSWLNWLTFEHTREYSLASLDKNRRRQVRLAAKDFEIRPVTDREEFKRDAHPAYVSFHNRTGYKVGAERRDPGAFARWADQVFANPDVLVLGGYRAGRLGGVSLTYRFGSTIYYATFFCDDASLERYLSDLMLHTVRTAAALVPEITHVYAGMFKGIRGLDDFYLHRGAKLVRQRARLELNPCARLLLRSFLPAQFDRLVGNLTAEQLAQAGVNATETA